MEVFLMSRATPGRKQGGGWGHLILGSMQYFLLPDTTGLHDSSVT